MSSTWDELLALIASKNQPYWGGLSFPPEMEQQFQQDVKGTKWYEQFKSGYNQEPNLDSSNYNYRRAWFNNVMPQDTLTDSIQHWKSSTPMGGHLKAANHPTEWLNNWMSIPGTQDPNQTRDAIYRKLLGLR